MEEHALKGEYISALRNGVLSYGGSQRWLDSGALRQCGCGVIAAPDLLLYLRQQRTGLPVADGVLLGRPYRLGQGRNSTAADGDSASLLCTILDVRAK